jgi:hypothetical protein
VLVDGGAPPLDCASGDVDICIGDILGLAEAIRPLLGDPKGL